MSGREYKAVAIEPTGLGCVVAEGVPKQDRTNLRTPQRQTKMPGRTGVDGIHGEAAGFSCGALQVGKWEIHR